MLPSQTNQTSQGSEQRTYQESDSENAPNENLLSDPHEKFPVSSLKALNFWFPPRVRTVWIRLLPSCKQKHKDSNHNAGILCRCSGMFIELDFDLIMGGNGWIPGFSYHVDQAYKRERCR